MNKVLVDNLMSAGTQEIYIKEGTAETVGELIDLLSTIPKDYKISLSGMGMYSIAIDDVEKTVLIDDSKWIDEHIYQLNEENERSQ